MENCQTPETVIYEKKEYTEIVLNRKTDGAPDHGETEEARRNVVHVSSLDDDDDDNLQEERNWSTCQDSEVLKTVPCSSFHDKYVSKKVLSVGSRGLKPHNHSICTFIIESRVLLESSFSNILIDCSVFSKNNLNTELELEIGSSDTELERALELALMDMFEGERSEVILCASNREDKLRDQNVVPVPCMKCILNLRKVVNNSKLVDIPANCNSPLWLLEINNENRFYAALKEKDCGVELFKRKRFVDAFHRFASGAKIIMSSDSFLLECGDEKSNIKSRDEKDNLLLYSTLCSNMAECQLKENNPTLAITLCRKALVHDPCNVKALFRQALAAWTLGDVDQADSLLRRVFELDPTNSAAKHLNSQVQVKIKKYEDEYTKMMKRIFSQ